MQVQYLYTLALDVDDKKFHGFAISTRTGEVIEFRCEPNVSALKKHLIKISGQPNDFRICYEATYLGFSLCRQLRANGYHCDVIAPSLIPTVAGDKVKTDRLDAEKLARYYLAGMLTIVNVPAPELEADRNLLRSRKFVAVQRSALKHHINSITRIAGWDYKQERSRKQNWKGDYIKWLREKIKCTELHSLKFSLEILLKQYDDLCNTIIEFDAKIDLLGEKSEYKKTVKALSCFRGIDRLTALVLLTEIGDIRRFAHPRQLTSYAGIDVIEKSSGGKERKFGISKDGNRFIRTAVVEACQSSDKASTMSRALKERRDGAELQHIEIADRCMHRLRGKSRKLLARGKMRNKVKVACAREMLGFIWETMRTTA
jgi:transposase